MSIQNEYLSGLMERVVRRNPAEPEFHQAVQEVLTSLVPVVEAKPEYIKEGVMDCLVEPERIIKFRVPCSTAPSAPTKAAYGSTPPCTRASSSFWALSRSSRTA